MVTPSEPEFEAVVPVGDATDSPVFRVDGGYVVAARHVVGFGAGGKRRWTHRLPSTKEIEAHLVDGVVVVSFRQEDDEKVWPTPRTTVGLAPDSGAVLWRDDRSSFVSVHGQNVFTTECVGVQDGTLGNCTLRSRSPHSGSARWSIPTYHAAEITRNDDGRLVMVSRPEGGQPAVWNVLDAATGARLSRDLPHLQESVIVGDVIVSTRARDERPQDGCHGVIVGRDLSGAEVWRRRVVVGTVDYRDEPDCDNLHVDGSGDGLAGFSTYDGRPVVVDATSGRVVWRGREGEKVPVVSDSLLVAVSIDNGRGDGVRAVRPNGDRRLWSDPAASEATWLLVGGTLVSSASDCYDRCFTQLRDPRTGKVRKAFDGGLRAHGDDWVGTAETDHSGPETFRIGAR